VYYSTLGWRVIKKKKMSQPYTPYPAPLHSKQYVMQVTYAGPDTLGRNVLVRGSHMVPWNATLEEAHGNATNSTGKVRSPYQL